LPDDYKNLALPHQEPGTRSSSALPYELYTEGKLDGPQTSFVLSLHAADKRLGDKAVGVPFTVYAPGNYLQAADAGARISVAGDHAVSAPDAGAHPAAALVMKPVKTWSYAVAPGDTLTDSFPLSSFDQGQYHLRVYGPNGYFREFKGSADNPALDIACTYTETPAARSLMADRATGPSGRPAGGAHTAGPSAHLTGGISISFQPVGDTLTYDVTVVDHAYGKNDKQLTITAERQPHGISPFVLDLDTVNGWYDVSVLIRGYEAFEVRYAGRVETGEHSITDPFMGRVIL